MAQQPYQERWITVQDGLRLYLRDYDPGTAGDPAALPVLCLGGLTRNAKDFAGLAERLAKRRRVICLDYRGRGRSDYDTDWRHYCPEVYLSDITAVLVALSLHPVVICGTSLGGLLAMGLAALSPTALAGVILNDIGPDLNPSGIKRIGGYVGHDHPKEDWDGAVEEVKALFGHLNFPDEASWRSFAEATYRRGDDGLLHFDWDPAIGKALKEELAELPDLWKLYGALHHLPLLSLRGGESDILSPETFKLMGERHDDIYQVTLPGVGHTPSLNEADADQAIHDFLEHADATSQPH